MSQSEKTVEVPDRLVRVIWGRNDAVSRRAVAFAVVLFVVVAVFNYVHMAINPDVVSLDPPRGLYDLVLWQGLIRAFGHPGFVVVLAAIYAYLNEGYLPAGLLAAAPAMGMELWIFQGASVPGTYVIVPAPIADFWEWVPTVVRIVATYGTLGFLFGHVARYVRLEVLDRPAPV